MSFHDPRRRVLKGDGLSGVNLLLGRDHPRKWLFHLIFVRVAEIFSAYFQAARVKKASSEASDGLSLWAGQSPAREV